MHNSVWVIDDDNSIRWVLEKALGQAGIVTQAFACADQELERLDDDPPRAIVTDIRMPGMDGLEFMKTVHRQSPDLPVIIMTAHSDLDSAVNSYQGGAFEYLPKPFDVGEAVAIVQRAIEVANESLPPASENPGTEIIGQASAMQEVFRAIGRLSNSNVTVLITGPSGSGKELVARALHRHSRRSAKNFIALNVAAIPGELIESELFGHEKGAFTGAVNRRTGRFEQADGGTLFLDEIGDMPREVQTRLLRVLAEGEFYRVGGHDSVAVDVRIIAATHQNLEDLVQRGTFREDLFHRLNVIRVHVPSLAERREDIPLLIRHFLSRAAIELGEEAKVLPDTTARYLQNLAWPGNVRQLENTCRWLTVMASGREILIEDLPAELRPANADVQPSGDWEAALSSWAAQVLADGGERVLNEAQPKFERAMITAAMNAAGGKRKTAAELLGWGRNTLTRKIDELHLKAQFRD